MRFRKEYATVRSRGRKLWRLAEMSNPLLGGVTNLVLNAGTARLGQAMRETQDQLVRDELEATASVINSVGGVNGRSLVAVVKSDLIDLELLAA